MRHILTSAQIRAAEQRVFDTREDVDLMGRAAAGVARVTSTVAPEGTVLVVVGPGNNGGDGLFAAALLATRRPVLLWLVTGAAHEPGLKAAVLAGAQEVGAVAAISALSECAVVIDAFTGLGSRPGLPRRWRPSRPPVRPRGDRGLRGPAVGSRCGRQPAPSQLPRHPHRHLRLAQAVPRPAARLRPLRRGARHRHRPGEGRHQPAHRGGVRRRGMVAYPDEGSDKYSRGVVTLDTGSETYPGPRSSAAPGPCTRAPAWSATPAGPRPGSFFHGSPAS
ncbi:NAD(P)H-hydrate epimerase [Tessaracoccus coleopterorum]